MLDQILAADNDLVVAVLAATSCFTAILVVSWPYVAPDTLSVRMRQVAEERERIRVRERASLQASREPLVRAKPKKLYQTIVERIGHLAKAEESQTAQLLRLAGYRGRGPVVRYLAVRVLLPFLLLFLAVAYMLFGHSGTLPADLAVAVAAVAIGYYLPAILLKNQVAKRQTSIRRAWPEALDLMLICVESGMSIEVAFRKVSEEIGIQSVELAEELNITTAELSYLQDRRKAFDNLALRTGLDGVRAVVTSLIQAEKYGTPIGQALRVLAQENRDMRMSEAEKKAASLPPKLTVPMIVFFLPVLFAVITTPAIIQILRTTS